MSYDFRILRTVAQIEQIAPAWLDLMGSSGAALNDPAWHAAAARFVHGARDELHVLSLWQGERLMALAPLILARTARGVRYEIIGSRVLYEPAEIMARDLPASEAMAQRVAALERPVVLSRLPAGSAFQRAFCGLGKRSGLVLSPGSSGSPYLDLECGWEAYYAGLSSRTRDILRRSQRQLVKLGRVEVDIARPNAATAEAALMQAFQVELHSWKARAGSAVLQRDDLQRFFVHYGAQIAARGELLVALLRFDGVAIAAQVASVSRNAYWLLKIGYDERHAKYRPGLQLLLETLRWSFEQKLATYEFLGTNEAWLAEWTRQVRCHSTTLYYPWSASGLGGLFCDSVERVRHKVVGLLRSRA